MALVSHRLNTVDRIPEDDLHALTVTNVSVTKLRRESNPNLRRTTKRTFVDLREQVDLLHRGGPGAPEGGSDLAFIQTGASEKNCRKEVSAA